VTMRLAFASSRTTRASHERTTPRAYPRSSRDGPTALAVLSSCPPQQRCPRIDVHRPDDHGIDAPVPGRGDPQDVGGVSLWPLGPPGDLPRACRAVRRALQRARLDGYDRTTRIAVSCQWSVVSCWFMVSLRTTTDHSQLTTDRS